MTIKINSFKQKSFFDKKKNRYDESLIINPPFHTRAEIDNILTGLKDIKKNGTIVDFGAGNGRLTIPLLQNNFNVVSVDLSGKSLMRIKNLSNKLRLGKRLKISTTFPKRSNFAVVGGADILHHVDMNQYLPVIHKSLKKSGKVVFSEPGGWNIAWYIYLPIFISWEVERGIVNCTFYNFKNKFERYGFKNVKIKGLGLLPRPFFNFLPWLCTFNDWLGDLPFLKLFAYRYIIEASK